MAVTINAKGTSVSSFAVGKNGTLITQAGAISPPAANDLSLSAAAGQSIFLTVDTGELEVTSSAITSNVNFSAPNFTGTTSGTNTGDQTITLTGDVTGSGTGSFAATLSTTGVSAGTFAPSSITVDAKGRITAIVGGGGGGGSVTSVAVSGNNGIGVSGSPITTSGTITLSLGAITPTSVASSGTVTGTNLSGTNTGDQTITLTGDVTGTGTGSFATTLATVNGNVGTFGTASSVGTFTVNGKGLITAASNTSIQIAETQITDGALLARVNDNETITGNWTFNNVVVGVDPVAASNFATKQYVDNAVNGLKWKSPVVAATTANITLSAPQTIDGIGVVAGNRVLVKNQTASEDNGIYVVAAGAWTRAPDFDSLTPIDEINGAAVFVLTGTTQGDTSWVETSTVTTIGTDPIVFVQFSGAGAYVAGAGLTLTGNTFAVGTASASRIVVNVDDIDLATVTDSGTGTFLKLTRDSYGRVSGTTAVVAGDITPLVDSTYVNVSGDTMTGNLNISAANPALILQDTTPTTRSILYRTNNLNRWALTVNNTAEGGSNAGSNFVLNRYDDAGTVIGSVLSAVRSTGAVTISTPTSGTALTVNGVSAGTAASFTDGANYTLNIRKGTGVSARLESSSALAFITNSGTGVTETTMNTSGAWTIGQPSSGVALTVNSTTTTGPGLRINSVTGAGNEANLSFVATGSREYTIGARNTSGSLVIRDETSTADRVTLDSSGNLGLGTTTPSYQFDLQGTGGSPMALTRFSNTSSSTSITMAHSRGTTVGSNVIVQNNDILGSLLFSGANGTGYDLGAAIRAEVDGTPGASADMPGRLLFMTSADGSATLTERMRIGNGGNISIAAPTSGQPVSIAGGGIDFSSVSTLNMTAAGDFTMNASNASGALVARVAGAERFRITNTGAATFSSSVDAVSFNATSTKRVKKAIKNIAQATVDKFSQLKPREYDRKDYAAHEFGFIAEEMALVYPEVVGKDKNGKPTGIDYGKLSTILTAKVQEQQKVINELQAQMKMVLDVLKGKK